MLDQLPSAAKIGIICLAIAEAVYWATRTNEPMAPAAAVGFVLVALALGLPSGKVANPPNSLPCSPTWDVQFLLCPDEGNRDLYAPEWRNDKGDSGADIRFPQDVLLPEGQTTLVNLGVRAMCLARGRASGFWLATRSSFTKTPQTLMLRNFMGVIDAGYRGSLMVRVHNFGPGDFVARRGDSLFQILEPLMEPPTAIVVGADDPRFAAGVTARGEGGFGSTGTAGQAAASASGEPSKAGGAEK